LEAIDFFQKDVPEPERHVIIPKGKKTNFNDDISVEATIVLDESDEKRVATFAATKGFTITEPIKSFTRKKVYSYKNSRFDNTASNIGIKLIGKKGKSKSVKVLPYTDPMWQEIIAYLKSDVLPPIVYYPNFLFNFPQKIYLDENTSDQKDQRFYRQVLQDVLDSLKEDLNIEEHLLERLPSADTADKESLEAVINKMGVAVTGRIFTTWDRIFRSTAKGQKTETRRREIKISTGKDDSAGGRYFIEIKLKHGSEQYSINELSLGFKWFFSFLLFTEFRKNRADDNGEILFLLDEPASNLHSTAQSKLLETFQELIDRSKLVYTTHSHHLINPLWLEGTFIVKNNALDYATDDLGEYDVSKTDVALVPYRQFVQSFPGQRPYFKPILDSLDYQPSQLELVPSIIIVEGKNDFYTLRYLRDVILEPKENRKDLKFYPGNGAGKNDQIVRLYVAWGTRVTVLNDDDTAGRAANEKYLEEIGPVISGHLFTLKDVDPTWDGFATEQLFCDEDKEKILQKFAPEEPKYSKEKFNNAINYLLNSQEKVELTDMTKNNFAKLLDFLATL
jgi:predicted ATP-dependent endonuclease of OLD family